MENSHELFDDSIRAKLKNFDVPGAPEGWEVLEQKMALDADASLDPFDEMIKSKLEKGQAAYNPGLWSLMESKIEADVDLSIPELEDVQFDGLIYENLNSYKVPYNANHWDLMLQRIKEEFSLQYNLYRYKVAEISLMVLAILTLLQFYPGQENTTNAVNENIAGTEQILPSKGDQLSNNNNTNTAIAKNITPIELESLSLNENGIADIAQTQNKNLIAAVAIDQEIENSVSIENILPPLVKETKGGTSISTTQLPAIEAVAQAETDAVAKQQELLKASLLFDKSVLGMLSLETTQTEAFEAGENIDPLPSCKNCQPKKRWAFKLGMLTSMDFNLVMTPYDEYFSANSYDQLTSGYTGGLSFSIHRNRLGFATGVTYSSKAYEVKENIELHGSLAKGYVEEGLQAAQLNILSIPLNLTYTFDNSGKWQWYSVLGTSAKIAVINNYDIKSAPVSRNAFPVDPRIEAITEPTTDVQPEDPYAGAFDGGSFKKNLFFTANLGLGMERYVTPRWSVFIQPTYQHSLYKRGLGPNNDRIHSMSLFLGTRATLK